MFNEYIRNPVHLDEDYIETCPVCGSDIYDEIYINEDDEALGCNECIKKIEPFDYTNRIKERLSL